MPSDTVPEEHVVTQTRRGYKMGDKLLRAAQVVVSSGPAAD
jgi:molecular chaperone GrpE